MTDKNTLGLAREWAATVRDGVNVGPNKDRVRAAADLISSLPDEWVDADTLRKYISDWRAGLANATRDDYEDEILDDLESLLPAPPAPRTMDEIEWDDEEHHLAEATAAWTEGTTSEVVMLHRRGGTIAAYQLAPNYTGLRELNPAILTPTGRKYRMEPEDDVASATGGELTTQDVVDECRAVRKERAAAESASPRKTHGQPEPRTGESWLIDIDGERTVALLGKVDPADDEPTWFTDDGGGYSFDSGNPVARLVPETTEQDDEEASSNKEAMGESMADFADRIFGRFPAGEDLCAHVNRASVEHHQERMRATEFDPAYTYRDKDGDEWEYLDGRWIVGTTHADRVAAAREDSPGIDSLLAEFAPYTRIEQDDETVFDPAYTYRDRQGDVWRYEEEEWWCYQQNYRTFRSADTPPAEFGPYTRIEDTK